MKILHLSFLILIVASTSSNAKEPLNLLFILTDNQPASIIGSYGNKDVRTPHIDQLAAQGMRFTNAFAVNGMCSPTRATLMTGLLPSQHGVHNWLDDEELKHWPKDWSAVAEYRTLPYTLAQRGYKTAMIGKWHLGQPWQASIGYQHWVTFTDGHTVDFWNNTVIENDQSYQVADQHIVDFFADKAVEFIAQHDKSRPFYLQLNFDGPYLNPPTNTGPAKNRHYESYLGSTFESFPRLAVNPNILEQLSDPQVPAFLKGMHKQSILHNNDPESMANVASQNTIVDDGVGKVLQALDSAGMANNTLVVFSSDQGNFYGQHGLWQHITVTTPANLYEAALNIPLIVKHPGKIHAGKVSERLIGQYDIPRTLLDYLGFNNVQLGNSPGRSFVSVLHGQEAGWDDTVYYEQEESRGVRTKRYAYWKRLAQLGENALYDMQSDPQQKHNLIERSALQGVVKVLDAKVDAFFKRHSVIKYDLWQGGIAKGSVMRPYMFKQLYGDDWAPVTEAVQVFKE